MSLINSQSSLGLSNISPSAPNSGLSVDQPTFLSPPQHPSHLHPNPQPSANSDPREQRSPRPQVRSHHSAPSLTPFRGTSTSPILQRSWNPATSPVPLTGEVDGKKIGLGTVSASPSPSPSPTKSPYCTIGGLGVEDGLSELYLSHERIEREAGSSPAKRSLGPAGSSRGNSKDGRGSASRDGDGANITAVNTISNPSPTSKGKGKAKTLDVEAAEAAPSHKSGWGETLVSGAMTAGVFGAALGLSAYRLWSMRKERLEDPMDIASGGENEPPDRIIDSARSEAGNVQPASSSLSPQPNLVDQPDIPIAATNEPTTLADVAEPEGTLELPQPTEMVPPPAYEETEGPLRTGTKDDWEELDETATPSSSRIHTTKSPVYRSSRRKQHKARASRSKFPLSHSISAQKGVPAIQVVDQASPDHGHRTKYDDVFSSPSLARTTTADSTASADASARDDGYASRRSPESEQSEVEVGGDSETDDMVMRLDNMSTQLNMLIEQGKAALESTPVLDSTSGWNEDHESPPETSYDLLQEIEVESEVRFTTPEKQAAQEITPRSSATRPSTCQSGGGSGSGSRIPVRSYKTGGHQQTSSFGGGSRRQSKIPIRRESIGMSTSMSMSAGTTVAEPR